MDLKRLIRVPMALALPVLVCAAMLVAGALEAKGSATEDVGEPRGTFIAAIGTGEAGRALRLGEVGIHAQSPATMQTKLVQQRISLPVEEIAISNRVHATLAGSLVVRRGRRAVRLTALQVSIGPRGGMLIARVWGRNFNLMRTTGRVAISPEGGEFRLRTSNLILTREAAQMLRVVLGFRAARAGVVGKTAAYGSIAH